MNDIERNPSRLFALLRRINVCRGVSPDEALEALVEQHYQPSCRLAVYGTLAPGEVNEHQLSGLAGTWSPVLLHGERSANGWGLTGGYPGFRWDEAGGEIPALVFTSQALPSHWHRLDRFEGSAYCRILVPVYIISENHFSVANTYEPQRPGRRAMSWRQSKR